MPTTTRHIGMTKRCIRQMIQREGAKAILVSWEGTDEDALQELRDDPREVFCSCDCKKNPDGSCSVEKE